MKNEQLALRRQALLAECALQRASAAIAIVDLRTPANEQTGWLGMLGSANLKVPLTIAGVVAGLVLTNPKRAVPVLTAGLSLFKLARRLLPLLRQKAG
jgi:hypothetical protein